jgi:hypothetical protein
MRALVVALLLSACSSTKGNTMVWDNEDAKMSASKVTALSTNTSVQLGQSLQLRPNTAGSSQLSTAAKDLARWRGKSESDAQPIRIYLGAWQPNPKLPGNTVLPPTWSDYMQPTPWQLPQPTQFDAFATGSLFARISFGVGGVQHVAFVDWPPRGLLFQVSAQYVQVDAYGTLAIPPGGDETTLPRLLAHIAPEPGGGDSVQPGTYTYPNIDFNPNPGPNAGVLFQVPPFARAFRPLIDQSEAINLQQAYVVTVQSNPQGGISHSWLLDPFDYNGFNREDLPLDGTARDVVIQAIDSTALPGTITPKTTVNVGCMFLLDL